jgi:hypothetical protein
MNYTCPDPTCPNPGTCTQRTLNGRHAALSHYAPTQPGQYPAPKPPLPPVRRMPWWAWALVILVGIPATIGGAATALIGGAGMAEQAGDRAPVISTAQPTAPVDTYDPGIQTPPTKPAAPSPKVTHKPAPRTLVPEDGMLLVGKDVKPGTYQTRVLAGPIPSCYWARLKDVDDSLRSIIKNDLVTVAGALVTLRIRPTDYAVTIQCAGATWVRVGY